MDPAERVGKYIECEARSAAHCNFSEYAIVVYTGGRRNSLAT